MRQKIWTVTPEKIEELIGDPEWHTYSDFAKAEAIATFLRNAVPRFLARRFEYRVKALGTTTSDGREMFVVETGRPHEFD